MHSVTGVVTQLQQATAGWGDSVVAIGVMVNVQVTVPYIRMVDSKPINETKDVSVSMYYDVTTAPPLVGDKVTVTLEGIVDLLPDDEM